MRFPVHDGVLRDHADCCTAGWHQALQMCSSTHVSVHCCVWMIVPVFASYSEVEIHSRVIAFLFLLILRLSQYCLVMILILIRKGQGVLFFFS
jgi:hypothetical protein